MFEIKEILDTEEKSLICASILSALPSWFGIETSIIDYSERVKAMPFYAAFNNTTIGFVAIKNHNPFTSEIYVMGVLEEYHRQGLGKRLVEKCENYCKDNKIEFLTVKTLSSLNENKNYENTRLFYHVLGFRPLEVFPLLWDENNPCLFMAKYVGV